MPPGSGVALLDGVADGLGGSLVTVVGVGTGGSVSVGAGDRETVTAVLGAAEPEGTAIGAVAPAAEPLFRGTRDEWSMVVTGDVATRGGAAPIDPLPPGALIVVGAAAGAPSVQPTVTANGRPRATMPKKMDLGVSRT